MLIGEEGGKSSAVSPPKLVAVLSFPLFF